MSSSSSHNKERQVHVLTGNTGFAIYSHRDHPRTQHHTLIPLEGIKENLVATFVSKFTDDKKRAKHF